MTIYVAKLVEETKLRMKARFFDPKDTVSIVGFLATFKLARHTNKTYERAAMLVVPHIVKEPIANALNSCMCARVRTAPLAATVRYNKAWPRNLFRSSSNFVNYLLKKYVTGTAIAIHDVTLLFYMQPASNIPQLNTDSLIAKSSKVSDVYGESTADDLLIEDVDASIRHRLQDHWASLSNED